MNDFWEVNPSPGFCVKGRLVSCSSDQDFINAGNLVISSDPLSFDLDKVFINVCTCNELPSAPHITEEELARVIESENPGAYTLPLSIGEPHFELDKSGRQCSVYDCIINQNFYEDVVKKSDLFRAYVVNVAMGVLEDKYSISLDREHWVILKNKKHLGPLIGQTIRKAAPLIQDIGNAANSAHTEEDTGSCNLMDTIADDFKLPEPQYQLFRELPTACDGSFTVKCIFLLPSVSLANISSIKLGLQNDRILLLVPDLYELDIFLPITIDVTNAEAVYTNKKLTVNLNKCKYSGLPSIS